MKILRTPDERFARLEGYPFKANYVDISDGLRMHYVDEGPPGGRVVLLLHGEPTWSYLYRKMIPPIVQAGFRVVAPDLVGFGKSDKPSRVEDYTYERHQRWLLECLDRLELGPVILFCQDWGSFLGLRIAAEEPERFARVMVSNGGLPTSREPMSAAFRLWRAFAKYSPWFDSGRLVRAGTLYGIRSADVAAYNAPFPTREYLAGARAFPLLVPTDATHPAASATDRAWERLSRFEKPFLCVFGKDDPILGRMDRALLRHVPGARDQPHDRIRGRHFIQEDQGEELARRLVAWAGQWSEVS